MKPIYIVIVVALTVAVAGGVLVGPATAGYAALLVALPSLFFAGRSKKAADGRALKASEQRKQIQTNLEQTREQLNSLEDVVVGEMAELKTRMSSVPHDAAAPSPTGVHEDYAALVDRLVKAAPELRHQIKTAAVGREAENLRLSALVRPHLQRLVSEAPELAKACRSRGIDVRVETSVVPSSLFVPTAPIMVLHLASGRSWDITIDNRVGGPGELKIRLQETVPLAYEGEDDLVRQLNKMAAVQAGETKERSMGLCMRFAPRFAQDSTNECTCIDWPFLEEPSVEFERMKSGSPVLWCEIAAVGTILVEFCAHAIQEDLAERAVSPAAAG